MQITAVAYSPLQVFQCVPTMLATHPMASARSCINRARHHSSIRAPHCRMAEAGVVCERIRLVGGGSHSPLWRRVAADAFQRPLVFPVEADSAALGAALQAAAVHAQADIAQFVVAHAPELEARELEPDAKLASLYADGLQRHEALGGALFGSGGAAY